MFSRELLRASMVFLDNITFAIFLWNFGVLGLVSIHWRSPLILQQAYLIFNSVQMALIFLKFLPKWTCWVLLGALAIWGMLLIAPWFTMLVLLIWHLSTRNIFYCKNKIGMVQSWPIPEIRSLWLNLHFCPIIWPLLAMSRLVMYHQMFGVLL